MKHVKREKILVIDDDKLVRMTLESVLSTRDYKVLTASTGEEGLTVASVELPDLIILDLSMPGMSGIDVCRELRESSKVPIIVLSVYNQEFEKVASLEAGADDYIVKPFNTAELIARIRAHIRRARRFASGKLAFESKGLRIDLNKYQVFLNDEPIKLTKTEFAILQQLFKNRGNPVSYKILLTTIWGAEYENDYHTLRVHIGNMRKKIEIDPDNPEFIITEPGLGYRFNM